VHCGQAQSIRICGCILWPATGTFSMCCCCRARLFALVSKRPSCQVMRALPCARHACAPSLTFPFAVCLLGLRNARLSHITHCLSPTNIQRILRVTRPCHVCRRPSHIARLAANNRCPHTLTAHASIAGIPQPNRCPVLNIYCTFPLSHSARCRTSVTHCPRPRWSLFIPHLIAP
jgi:hypothetical protein